MSPRPTHTLHDQVLSLAGVAQFALYAHELASQGRDLPDRIEHAKRAIFCTDPDAVMDVYGGETGHLRDGLRYLRVQFAGRKPDADGAVVARYIGQVLRLSGSLMKHPQALARLRGAIDRARLAEPADVPAILDEAYRESISPQRPRIMVQGHPSYLGNDAIQARVRTQLMAAVRCGVMWRQCGGRFATLFFRRKRMLAALDREDG